MVSTFSLLKIQHCSSYSCCTELASGDCQGKNYNPVCWLMFLTEDWTVLGVFNENRVGCFQQQRWLSSFYGLTMYFIQNILVFLFFGSFFSTIWELCSLSGEVNLLALRLSFSSHEERVHVGYNASLILFFTFSICT